MGTKWANECVESLIKENTKYDNQNVSPKKSVNDKCLDEVNVYGVSPNRLFKIISVKIPIAQCVCPGEFNFPKFILNSICKEKIIFLKIIIIWFFEIQNKFGIKKIRIILEIQLGVTLKDELGSKVENKLFIIKFISFIKFTLLCLLLIFYYIILFNVINF